MAGERRALAEFPQRATSTCWVCGEAPNQLGGQREKGCRGADISLAPTTHCEKDIPRSSLKEPGGPIQLVGAGGLATPLEPYRALGNHHGGPIAN